MSEEITPALSAEEWKDGNQRIYFRQPRRRAPLASMDDGYGVERCKDGTLAVWDDSWGLTIPAENRHALAALCLYGQPYGSTREDVRLLNALAAEWERDIDEGKHADEAYSRLQLGRLRSLAARLAAILPPSDG